MRRGKKILRDYTHLVDGVAVLTPAREEATKSNVLLHSYGIAKATGKKKKAGKKAERPRSGPTHRQLKKRAKKKKEKRGGRMSKPGRHHHPKQHLTRR